MGGSGGVVGGRGRGVSGSGGVVGGRGRGVSGRVREWVEVEG